MTRVGFIGLGVMGEAMCRNIVRSARYTVNVFDLSQTPVARLAAEGATAMASAAELVEASDTVLLCLPGGAEVEARLYGGENLLIERFQGGQTLVDMSTSPPLLMRRIEADLQARSVRFADAPVARTRQAALDGTLAIMVGGVEAVFSEIEPLLATMGRDIIHCGPAGSGQVVKIMNNMVLFQTVNALAEAVSIAEHAGVDGSVLFDVMSKSSGDSFALRNHGVKSLLPNDYPARAFSVRYAAKDLSYARELAEAFGLSVEGAAATARVFDGALAAGDGDFYFPVIRRCIENGGT